MRFLTVKNISWLMVVVLVIANVYFFIQSIRLGNEIKFYEKETDKLYKENLELAKEADYLDSLIYASSKAAELKFTKRSQPIYLKNLKYAWK